MSKKTIPKENKTKKKALCDLTDSQVPVIEYEWPPEAHIFECLVIRMPCYLRRIWRCGLVQGGGVSLGVSFAVSKAHRSPSESPIPFKNTFKIHFCFVLKSSYLYQELVPCCERL